MICDNYAEKRAIELNNVAGKKRKRTKTAKAKELALEEQTSTPSTSSLLDTEGDNDADIADTATGKASKIVPQKKQKTSGEKKKKNKVKEPSLKDTQLESAKLMAREVIEVMQRENPRENDYQIPVAHNETSPNTACQITASSESITSPKYTTPLSYGTGLTPPSGLQPSKWSSTSSINPSQKDGAQTLCDSPFSSPTAYTANMPINFTTSTPSNKHSSSSSSINSQSIQLTNSHMSFNRAARRELQLLTNDPDETAVPLSSEISSAIRLSYDCDGEWSEKCDEWQDECKKADAIPPECSECAKLREENVRLKGTIVRLRKEKENFAGNFSLLTIVQ